jgi:hypothetical protein
MKVTETARIKGLTPPDWHDCLQTHILTYQKRAIKKSYRQVGNGAGPLGDCGKGKTTLTRRTVSRNFLLSINRIAGTHFQLKVEQATISDSVKKVVPPPVAKRNLKPVRQLPKPEVKSKSRTTWWLQNYS